MKNTRAVNPASKWLAKVYLLIFVVLAIGICGIGYWYLRVQIRDSRIAVEKEISGISQLKVDQISHWYSEHLDHAKFFSSMKWLAENLVKLESESQGSTVKDEIAQFIDSVTTQLSHGRTLIFDSNGQLLFSSPRDDSWIGYLAQENISKAIASPEIVVTDLHISKVKPGFVNMDIFVPINLEKDGRKKLVGIVMMEIDPKDFLFPLIQSWPSPSRTAETLLVSRKDNEVIFMNELRHQKNTALTLKFALERDSRLPAAMAVMGKVGIVEGVDYRGKEVIADIRKVPGTPWFIVAKIDKDEVYAPIKKQAWTTLILILAMIFSAALGVGLLWKKRDAELLRKSHYELEKRVEERTAELNMVNNELESFSYSVSHDLKAPLRSVDGFARMLEEDYSGKLDDEGKRLLNVIRESAKDMGQLINDLLEFSRMSRKEMHKAEIDMNELVREVFSQLESGLVGRKVILETGPLPNVSGDPAMMREVVINLLSNAIKFTATRKEGLVKVEGRQAEGKVIYTFKDNGVGFDMAYKNKLFCVFQRLHGAEFEGTGIGLALVQRIIQRHGGKVWADAKEGEGAEFSLALPLGEKKQDLL